MEIVFWRPRRWRVEEHFPCGYWGTCILKCHWQELGLRCGVKEKVGFEESVFFAGGEGLSKAPLRCSREAVVVCLRAVPASRANGNAVSRCHFA